MADADGKLTQAEKNIVKNWLLKWDIKPCPICKETHWVIADHLVQPVTLGGKNNLQLGGLGYPQVMLISKSCGYTRFLNAVVVGVVKSDPPEKKVEK